MPSPRYPCPAVMDLRLEVPFFGSASTGPDSARESSHAAPGTAMLHGFETRCWFSVDSLPSVSWLYRNNPLSAATPPEYSSAIGWSRGVARDAEQ